MLDTPAQTSVLSLDCAQLTTRELNQRLKALAAEGIPAVRVLNPEGRHNVAVGLTGPIQVTVEGSIGYYCGGLADGPTLEILGSSGWSLGENLMNGQILVRGNASACAAASAHGGKVIVLGNAGPRAGISLKGATLVVLGNVSYSAAFMMQAGRLIIAGDAGPNLGDSMYQGEIFVGGELTSLGADACETEITYGDWQTLEQELLPWGLDPHSRPFKKVVCAGELYHFKAKDWSKWKDAY